MAAELGPLAYVPAALVVFLYLYTFGIYNFVFLLQLLPEEKKGLEAPAFFVLFNTMWTMAVWSYLRTRCSDPGRIPDRWRTLLRSSAGVRILPSEPAFQPGVATHCKKCNDARPERAHHCSACNRCVLRMDHHCPWTGNCVGFANYKWFLLLGVYTSLGCFVGVATTVPELWTCITSAGSCGLDPFSNVLFVLFGVITIAAFFLMASMLFSHVPLACQNMTSIEELYDNMENPYDYHHWLANLSQVMGAFGPDWLFPVRPWRPLSDGVVFSEPIELSANMADSDNDNEDLWLSRYGRPEARMMPMLPAQPNLLR
mmetsp:Transcript_2109/g.4811  ORF Transcript_2109/g.4811 Transcript_2109/m.4811 type:complete len:314 (-) Transcript_2109:20-961(-)